MLTDSFAELIRMHQELITMLAAVVEQNANILQMMVEQGDEEEPTRYMDGTPVRY